MTVFVDDMFAEYKGMIMCHMIADNDIELFAMANKIGVDLRWHQCKGTWKSHFDICLSKRKLALRYGAVEITQRDLAMKLWNRRKNFKNKGPSKRTRKKPIQIRRRRKAYA